jgi:3-hydroxybutyryl-CoA dehydratase
MVTKTARTNVETANMSTIPSADLDAIKIGDQATCSLDVTEKHIELFAELSGDDNALHMDGEFAQRLGFDGRVAHGMIALSMISRLIGTQLPGHGSLWISQELRFALPVQIGDALEARVQVTQISQAARVVVLQTEVVNRETGTFVLRGIAKVRVPLPEDATA